jgi:hypothetical protein
MALPSGGSPVRRSAIHSASVHSKVERLITDEVSGGSSASKAIGSAFIRISPLWATISNL